MIEPKSMAYRLLRTFFTMALMWQAPAAMAATVILETTLGNIEIELFDEDAPLTTQNFLNYVNDGDYQDSFIHRSVPEFIIQGGGYTFTEGTVFQVPEDPPVINEFSRSNTRGTISMAKLGNDPNSATSEWFINLGDNSENLDDQNGGFTVFGQVIGNGMDVVDAIAALTIWNAGAPFDELPLIDYSPEQNVARENLVMVNAREGGIPLNPGLNGSWANFDTLGQGFFIDVLPNIPLIFLAWFTWETSQQAPAGSGDSLQQASGSGNKLQAVVGDDNHRWMTAQGFYAGSIADLDVTLTTGGLFDNPQVTDNSDPGTQGTISISFSDCKNGIVKYDFTAAGVSGEVPIRRLADDNAPICEAFISTGE
jgi:cyclophilin family peptidyl-prolyl cis-trans isomerase